MKNVKKYLVYSIFCLLAVLMFNDNVYADEQYKCLYDGVLEIEYNPVNDKVTWIGNIIKDNCGTNDNPCKIVNKVLEVEGTGLMGRLDQKEWSFFDSNGEFSCPKIFHFSECYTATNNKVTCKYTFAPYKNEKKNITSESISSMNASTTTNKTDTSTSNNLCTDEQKNTFYNKINQIADDYAKQMESYISGIQSNQSASYYSIYYKNILYKNIGYARTNASVAFKRAIVCVMDEDDENYKTSKANFDQVIDTQTQNYLNALINKTQEAMNTNGDSDRQYSSLLLELGVEKETLDSYTNSYNEGLNEYFQSYKDKYAPITETCEGILSPALVDIINEVMTIIRIVVPILLIVLGTIDFSKAVLLQEKDESKKAVSTFVKRCIIAIAIFFVPTVIHILVDIFNSVSDIPITDLPDCGIK